MTLLVATALATPVDAWVRVLDEGDRALLEAAPAGFQEQQDGDWLRVHANEATLRELSDAGLVVRTAEAGSVPTFDVDEVKERLEAVGGLVQVGVSATGAPVWGVELGEPSGPLWRVLGGLHHRIAQISAP